jgi:hypothetical protein
MLMATTGPTQRGTDPSASTTPMPTGDATPQLLPQTVTWLAKHAHARRVIRSVWDKLTELEHAGHHPDTITALRSVLTHHQPTPAGRCPTCRRLPWHHLWRRQPFPCMVWHQIRIEILGVFSRGDHHRPPQ